jgi:hypothetical protein
MIGMAQLSAKDAKYIEYYKSEIEKHIIKTNKAKEFNDWAIEKKAKAFDDYKAHKLFQNKMLDDEHTTYISYCNDKIDFKMRMLAKYSTRPQKNPENETPAAEGGATQEFPG